MCDQFCWEKKMQIVMIHDMNMYFFPHRALVSRQDVRIAMRLERVLWCPDTDAILWRQILRPLCMYVSDMADISVQKSVICVKNWHFATLSDAPTDAILWRQILRPGIDLRGRRIMPQPTWVGSIGGRDVAQEQQDHSDQLSRGVCKAIEDPSCLPTIIIIIPRDIVWSW